MTAEVILTLAILLLAIILFVTERLRVDVVAMMVLGALALTGLVTPNEALSGFSSPAVITVGAVLILSAGLARTGVANLIGNRVLVLAGNSETRLLIVVMLTVGVMSAFMNDIGVAALMLPVVIEITRKVGLPPSKLLIPLAFGALLGGLNTLIGTPPNILVSDILVQYGLEPFKMFDYTPVGVPLMLVGIAYMVLVGRRILPAGDITQAFRDAGRAPDQVIDMQERLFVVRLPVDSALNGRTLAESQLGSALGLNVISIMRNGQTHFAPGAKDTLCSGDQLLVAGRPDRLAAVPDRQAITVADEELVIEDLVSAELEMVEVGLSPRSPLLGQTLKQVDFRCRYGAFVLSIWRDDVPIRRGFDTLQLQTGDTLLVYGPHAEVDLLRETPGFLVSGTEATQLYRLQEQLLVVTIPEGSKLVGQLLAESRLAETFGLAVLGVVRDGQTHLMVTAEERFQAGDKLLVKGDAQNIAAMHQLEDLEMEAGGPPDLAHISSEQAGLVEVVISPKAAFTGQSLREINFREKHGLSVLAIWREGRAYRSNLRDMPLHFGDTLLLYGPREKLRVLNKEPGFLVLASEVQQAPRKRKAPLAIAIMAAVLLSVIFGWLHIAIAAVVGATLMILSGCLNMEEAYGAIEWKAIFLIAGMLPLGIAMEQTGAARFVAEGVVDLIGGFGPYAIIAGIFLLTTLSTEVMPNPAVAVLMAPIVINTAADLGMSTHALMMTVAVAASAAFISPVGHPVNILVMGPGGYRFKDYLKVGIPLNFVILGVLLVVLPIFWPLYP
jgi:di/tricarboxylate transporter